MPDINIIEFSTFYKIPKIQGHDYTALTRILSVPNFYTQEYTPYGYFEYKTHFRICKIPEPLMLRSLSKCGFWDPNVIRSDNFPYKETKGYNMVNPPKDDLQRKVIEKAMRFLRKEERCIISLQTGRGKTYVATNIMSQLKVKALVLVKTTDLKDQWVESFSNHTDLKLKDVYTIDNGDDFYALKENDSIDPQVVICTHRSISMFIDKLGMSEFTRFMVTQGFGIKVFDEFDLENKSMFTLDTMTSIRYNLYLSATTRKSSMDDNRIFQRIFSEVENVGPEFRVTVPRNGLFVIYSSDPDKRTYNKLLKWTPKGMMLDYQAYHAYVVNNRTYTKPLKEIWDKMIKKRFESDELLKTVLFIGRKGDLSEQFKKDLVDLFGIKESDIDILNSDTPNKERDRIMKNSKLIISTSKSMGRGIDLKGLDIIVDLETRASETETEQVIGRVSRSGMKTVGTYISLVDYSIGTVKDNYLKKIESGLFKQHLTEIKEMSVGKVTNNPVKAKEDNGIRLIIAGSRDFDNYELLKEEVDKYIKSMDKPVVEIVSGKAKGADLLGEKYAKEKGLSIAEFPAEWDKYGKKAGYLRNTEMGKYADYAICFTNGSKGTEMMINIMKYFKKPYKRIQF